MKRKIIEGTLIFIVTCLITAAWSGTTKVWFLENAVKSIDDKLEKIEDRLIKITCRLVPDDLDCS